MDRAKRVRWPLASVLLVTLLTTGCGARTDSSAPGVVVSPTTTRQHRPVSTPDANAPIAPATTTTTVSLPDLTELDQLVSQLDADVDAIEETKSNTEGDVK